MGKLLIIPRSDTTRHNARVNSKGEKEQGTTATAAIVVGSSSTSGAIADSAAADRDRRFLIASIIGNNLPSKECERESRSISGIVDATRRTTIGNVVRSDLVRNNALDTDAKRWNARIAINDGYTCCFSSVDVTPFFPRRRARDRAISCEHFTSSLLERRNRRRAVSSSLTRSKSVTAPIEVAEVDKAPYNTVDNNTIGREDRNRFSVPYIGSTDRISKCDDCTLSDSNLNNAASRYVDESPRIVLKVRKSIDVNDTGNVWANNNIYNLAGLIGLVKSSCIFAEEVVDRGTSSSSQFPARLDRSEQTWRSKTYWRLPRIGLVRRALLLGLLVMSLLCDVVLAAPPSSSSLSTLEAIDTFENIIEEEELVPRNKLSNDELETIRRSIVQGLGLQRIPDPSKANVSQTEYERAHREYLKQVQLSHDGQESRRRRDLHVFQTTEHPGNRSSVNWRGGNHRRFLYFPVAVSEDVTVDHASLRFLLQGDHRRPRNLEVLIYLCTPISRRFLLRSKISQIQSTDSRWLELDFTEAATSWLERNLDNHGFELEFLHDGQPTQRDISYTTLNVFTTFESGSRRKRSTPDEIMSLHKGRRSKCKGNNKKCCRHELTVMFKDLEGFEFIVYPKGFDAGYCKGRCPPRYNPAHHHALLQSLLWKEDRKRVPKPCCAPSKLNQLMIVYFDENNTTKLKVSYWESIQVVECACS